MDPRTSPCATGLGDAYTSKAAARLPHSKRNHDIATRVGRAAGRGVVGAAGNLLGGLFVVRRDWPRRFLHYFMAMGAGYMLAVAFTDVIPESVRIGGQNAFLFVLIGYFLVHLFEHILAPHFHFGEETKTEMMGHHRARTVLVGLGIHTFFDGVAIAAGFLVSTWLGKVIFVAIFLHKLPEGVTIASVVVASGQSRGKAVAAAGALGVATLLGVLLTSMLQAQLRYALPLSAGVTVYVAAADLLPGGNREPGWRTAVLVLGGVACLLILQWLVRVWIRPSFTSFFPNVCDFLTTRWVGRVGPVCP